MRINQPHDTMTTTATTATESKFYTVDQYDRDEREWFIISSYRVDQAEANRIFDANKGGDRTRIQKWNGTAWITTRDSNTEA